MVTRPPRPMPRPSGGDGFDPNRDGEFEGGGGGGGGGGGEVLDAASPLAGGVSMGGLEEEAEEEEEAAAAGSGEGLGLMSPTEEDTFHGDDVEPVSTNMTV